MLEAPSLLVPTDTHLRSRFSTEIDFNFALEAPAGSGKTRAISDRIATIATSGDAVSRLERLVAVTYTNKAADEMRQRSGAAIRAKGVGEKALHAFERSFFGTIHSFSTHLLREFGYFIGVPSGFEVAVDADSLWKSFLMAQGGTAGDEIRARILRHLPFSDIQLASGKAPHGWTTGNPPGTAHAIDVSAALAFQPKRKQSAPTVARGQMQLKAFAKAWNSGEGFVELPEIKQGGEDFILLCSEILAGPKGWLRRAVAQWACLLHAEFRAWRVARGILTYDDQIALAGELFRNPDAARCIRERGYSVILDEAQDTHPGQFTLLLECARPVDSAGEWLDEGATPPAPGHFVMVLDFQQLIYSGRASIDVCRKAYAFVTQPGIGEALTFTTTFRCDRAVCDFVNRVGPKFLNGEDAQATYVPLSARQDAGTGEVIRLEVGESNEAAEGADNSMRAEGAAIGAFLRNQGKGGLGISAWNQVAVLAPRTSWLGDLRKGLLSEGVRSMVLSQTERNCDRPAYLWTTAVATILSEQRNSWEIAGVLRELFGLSDRALSSYSRGVGDRFRLDTSPHPAGDVADALTALIDLRKRTHGLPLRDAMEIVDRELLRPRLLALPVQHYGDVEADLDRLIALSARLESEGGDMVSLATQLRTNLFQKPDAHAEDPDAVCLLTNHKSKGLEWPVVVMAGSFRELSFENPCYPRLIRADDNTVSVAFDRADATHHDTLVAKNLRQEIERLLYVTLTRAKQLLVLVDDRAQWAGKGISELSLAGAMRIRDGDDAISGLSLDRTVLPTRALKAMGGRAADPFTLDLEAACTQSRLSPKKITPHRLAAGIDLEGIEGRTDDRNVSVPYAATHYGSWWHDLMRALPWYEGRDRWTAHFLERVSSSPDLARAKTEWALFLGSALSSRIEAASIVRPECPFVAGLQQGDAVEGFIDMVFREGDQWIVLDWKTARQHTLAEAIADYGPQLRSYSDVVSGISGQTAKAVVYLTARGECGEID